VTILAFVGTQLTFHVQCPSTFVFCLPTKFNTRRSSKLVRTGKIWFLCGCPNFCMPVLIQGEKETNAKARFLWKSHTAHNIKTLYQVMSVKLVSNAATFSDVTGLYSKWIPAKKGFDVMDWIYLAQDEVQSPTPVILVIKLLDTDKKGNPWPTWGITNFIQMTYVPWSSVSK
jgi:hypothetical protein